LTRGIRYLITGVIQPLFPGITRFHIFYLAGNAVHVRHMPISFFSPITFQISEKSTISLIVMSIRGIMKPLLLFLLIVCIGCASIAPAIAALPYSPSQPTVSVVLFSDTPGLWQDNSGVIAAGLIVISTPSGAEVLVDGAVPGTTPCTLPGLPSGVHIITIRMNGYKDWTRTVLIRDRHTVTLNAVLIPCQATPVPTISPKPTLTRPSITPPGTPIPSFTICPTLTTKPTLTHPSITPLGTPIPAPSMQIVSIPPGGAVVADGISRGITPCTLSGLSTGIHIIAMSLLTTLITPIVYRNWFYKGEYCEPAAEI